MDVGILIDALIDREGGYVANAADRGGPTCPCNRVPLCRRHHRAKTFSLWRYVTVQPGHYLWLSPHGRHFHVGPRGTRALDPPRRPDPDDHPPDDTA